MDSAATIAIIGLAAGIVVQLIVVAYLFGRLSERVGNAVKAREDDRKEARAAMDAMQKDFDRQIERVLDARNDHAERLGKSIDGVMNELRGVSHQLGDQNRQLGELTGRLVAIEQGRGYGPPQSVAVHRTMKVPP